MTETAPTTTTTRTDRARTAQDGPVGSMPVDTEGARTERRDAPTPTRIAVEAWTDPVVDQLGHDPRSAYVERFWLPVLGPSTIWFLRRVADALDLAPEGFELDLADTALSLGVGMRGGRNSPMLRTIDRSCRFGAARVQGPSTIAVRRRLAPLTRVQADRLPSSLRSEHDAWLSTPRTSPGFAELQARARTLALTLVELGESNDEVEHQLHRLRFHPAIAHEAVRWALSRHPSTRRPTSSTGQAGQAVKVRASSSNVRTP